MDYNLLILGSLLILVLFGVGESIYKKFKLNKIFLIIVLSLLLLGLYVPNLNIKNISINISGFLLPLILCIIFSFKIRSFGVFVNLLIVSFTILILRMGYTDLQFVPIIVCAVSMSLTGIAVALVSKDFFSMLLGTMFGFVLGNLIFDLIKYNVITNAFNFNALYFVLISLVFASLTLYIKLVTKKQYRQKQQAINPVKN